MGSPQRPDPGLPPSAEQNALIPEQQQQPAEVHATNQPSGALPSMVDDSPCSCSAPVLAAAECLQMPFASPALAGSSLTFSEQGISPPSSSAPFGFPGYDSRTFAQSSEPPLPGLQAFDGARDACLPYLSRKCCSSKMGSQCLRLLANRRCPIRIRARRTAAREDGMRRSSPPRRLS